MVTLKSIAQATGVSIGTVSDILNGPGSERYALATQEKIRRVAKELGYQPNLQARRLRHGRSDTLGFIIRELSNPYYGIFVQESEATATQLGYSMIFEEAISQADPREEATKLERMAALRVDAVLAILNFPTAHAEMLGAFTKRGCPVVLYGLGAESDLPVDAISFEIRPALEASVALMHGMGHRDYAFVGSVPWAQDPGEDRRIGMFRAALKKFGCSLEDRRIISCEHTMEGGYDATRHYLAKNKKNLPTALMAINDNIALGAMRAILDAGLRVPDDISIVGTDDIPSSRFLPIRLTTLAVPVREIARAGVNLAVSRLRGAPGQPHQALCLNAELVVRESVGPAPKRPSDRKS